MATCSSDKDKPRRLVKTGTGVLSAPYLFGCRSQILGPTPPVPPLRPRIADPAECDPEHRFSRMTNMGYVLLEPKNLKNSLAHVTRSLTFQPRRRF